MFRLHSHTARRRFRPAGLLALFSLLPLAVGCWHAQPYGGYPGGYPSYQQGMPGGYVAPQGGQFLTPATPGGPATLTPTPDNGLGAPSNQPFGGGAPDTFQPPSSGSSGSGGTSDPYYQGSPTDPRVPDNGYGDPGALPPAGGAGGTFDGDNSTPFGPGTAVEPAGGPALSAAAGSGMVRPVLHTAAEPQFLPPVQAGGTPAPDGADNVSLTEVRRVEVPAEARQQAAAWGYDRENYRWLRGIVERDAADGQWHLMYDPQPGDRWGGDLTLAGSSLPENLSEGAVIQVHGHLDETARDGRGKPLYQVEQIVGPLPMVLPAARNTGTVLR